MSKKKKVLVTGGAGFIGSHLVSSLVKEQYSVTVLDNLIRGNKLDREVLNRINFVKGDVRDATLVMRSAESCEWIFHLAAVLGVDIVADNPVETMEVESVGTRNIADAAIQQGVKKIIYASTSGVYGHSAIEKSVTENIQLDPRTSYAIAKRYNEIYLKALNEEKGLESISLRFFNVYGIKQDNRMVIPRFFEQAINDEPITVFGSGKQTRDFTYIEDVVKVSMMVAKKVSGCEIFNVANEHEEKITDLAKRIKTVVNSNSEILYVNAPKKRYDFEVERRVGNTKKLHRAINYQPDTSLDTGLKIVYDNYVKSSKKSGR